MMIASRFLLFLAICTEVAAQNITTIAGGGPVNLQALQTGLCRPSGIAIDNSGNAYVSVNSCNQIWKIDSFGQVNLFAGNGSFYASGDGGPAVNAALEGPSGLAFDSLGNLYVGTSSTRVRRISPAGIITTFAGNGMRGSAGDGGPATSAQLNLPGKVAVDSSNNVYIADAIENRVRMVSSSGTISTIAGTGIAGFSGDGGPAVSATLNNPVGVAVDSTGAVYIAEYLNKRVRRVSGGVISTVAGNGTSGVSGDGGPAISASLFGPYNVAVDRFDNLFIVDFAAIREVQAGQSTINRFAGTGSVGFSGDGGPYTAAAFSQITALAVDPNAPRILVVDNGNNRIRKLAGTVSTFAGNGTLDFNSEGLNALSASLYSPYALAANNSGSLYFSDSGASSIRKFPITLAAPTATGAQYVVASGTLSTVAGSGFMGNSPDGNPSTGSLAGPTAFVFGPNNNLYISEDSRVRKVVSGEYFSVANAADSRGFSGDGGPATAAQFYFANGLALAANGDLYIADTGNNRVRKVSAGTGIVTTIAGNGTGSSTGDGGLAVNAALNYPIRLALDGMGNLFVAEQSGNRVRKIVLSTNMISTYAGDGSFNFADGVLATQTGVPSPTGITLDQSGNLFIASGARIRKVTVNTGIISTVAGNGTYGFDGDGGPAISATISPIDLNLDRYQNLYFTDYTGRIRTFPVASCFFTLSTTDYSASNFAGVGQVSVTATYPSCPYTITSSSPFVTITSGASGIGSGTVSFLFGANTGSARSATVSVGGASFTIAQSAAPTAQFNAGMFQPSGPTWALDANGNGVFDTGDRLFAFGGQPGAIAVVGDWNGDGRSKVGYYINGFWVIDYNGDGVFNSADKFYAFGSSDPNYIPIVGDWNGSGTTKIGLYYKGFWFLDYDGDGVFTTADKLYAYGGNGAGEVPILGDWNGDHRTKIGLYYNGLFILDYDGNGLFSSVDKYYNNFTYLPGDKPVVGDWNGTGTTKIGVFRNGFWVLDYNGDGLYQNGIDKFYAFGGNVGEMPLVADWNGDGRSKIGLYNNGFWTLDFNGSGTYDAGDRFLAFYTGPGSQPVIGRW